MAKLGDTKVYGALTIAGEVKSDGPIRSKDITIDKFSSKVNLGVGSNDGPHGIDFYDASGGLGLSIYYRTSPQHLTIEHSDGTNIARVDKSNKRLDVFGGGGTIGANPANLSNSWLLIGTTTNGLGFDNNEIIHNGGDLHISASANIRLRTNTQVDGTLTVNGNSVWHAGNFTPSNYLLLTGGTLTGTLLFNKTLSSSNELINLQQGYSLYSDNTGSGSANSRAWIAGPDGGEFLIGPRAGSSTFHQVRLKANSAVIDTGSGNNTIWHAGNDGAGSGLDADTVDGSHASAFAAASHTHVAADVTAGTFAVARIPNLAASKITSGTFADARIAQSNVTQHQGALSITESQISNLGDYLLKTGGTMTGGLTLGGSTRLIGGFGAATTGGVTDWNDSSNAVGGSGVTLLMGNATNGPGPATYFHPFSFAYGNYSTGQLTQFAIPYAASSHIHRGIFFRGRFSDTWSSWYEVWHSGNDGSASGLDADLLDGSHASAFASASHTHTESDITDLGDYVTRTGAAQTITSAKTFTANLTLGNQTSIFLESPNGAIQRGNARDIGGSDSALYWYGMNSSGGTVKMDQRWYSGSSYRTITVNATTIEVDGNSVWHAGNLSPVTLDTTQTITGAKTFGDTVHITTDNFGPAIVDLSNQPAAGGWARGYEIWKNSAREVGLGLFGSGTSVTYAYFGTGTSPHTNGLRVYPNGSAQVNSNLVWHEGNLRALSNMTLAIDATSNWNNYEDTGFYKGQSLTNQPTGGHSWKYVQTIKHSGTWNVQNAYDFDGGFHWRRTKSSGTWQAWKQVWDEDSLEARTYRYSTTSSTGGTGVDLSPGMNAGAHLYVVGIRVSGTISGGGNVGWIYTGSYIRGGGANNQCSWLEFGRNGFGTDIVSSIQATTTGIVVNLDQYDPATNWLVQVHQLRGTI